MKEISMLLQVILFSIEIQLFLINQKFKKINKHKYKLSKSTNNKKFKIEFFENEEWKEMDTFNAVSVFNLFKSIQEELNAKSMFCNFVEYYENKEGISNEKEDKELEYKIVE